MIPSQIITILQAVTSVILIILILIQNPSGGLGKTFGSTVYHSRRGLEKVTFYLTVITAVLLVFLSLIRLVA
ncbi:MAG: preprotein translocase subunit SecG [bacterium]|nr:preprotein translocase subunit SecG [bacterium]